MRVLYLSVNPRGSLLRVSPRCPVSASAGQLVLRSLRPSPPLITNNNTTPYILGNTTRLDSDWMENGWRIARIRDTIPTLFGEYLQSLWSTYVLQIALVYPVFLTFRPLLLRHFYAADNQFRIPLRSIIVTRSRVQRMGYTVPAVRPQFCS